MKKRALSLFLALVFCFSMLPASALAEGEGGGVYIPPGSSDTGGGVYEAPKETAAAVLICGEEETTYDTLTAAVQAANASKGSTLKLKKDAAVNSTDGHGIEITGNFTLDLNGKTLSWGTGVCTESDRYGSLLYTTGYSHLTITDSKGGGKIVQSAGITALSVRNSSTVVINGGTIETTSTAGDTDLSNKTNPPNSAVYVLKGTAEIHGGTITGEKLGVAVCDGKLKITGGSVHGTQSNAVQALNGKVELSGGTYTTDEPDNHSIWNRNGAATNLLANGYRFEDGNGSESAYSDGNKNGVKGTTIVCKAPEETGVKYIGADGEATSPADCVKMTSEAMYLDMYSGWYAVTEDVTIEKMTLYEDDLNGDSINLILCDGAALTVNQPIHTNENRDTVTLNIYLQSGGTGKLVAVGGFALEDMVKLHCIGTHMKKESCDTFGFTLSKCEHERMTYTAQDETSHTGKCADCGVSTAGKHTFDEWVSKEDGTHTSTCTVCGYEKTAAHEMQYTGDPDGLTHSQTCSECGYKGETEAHSYTEQDINGYKWQQCACGALLAAEYGGTQYASLQAAVDAAKDGGTVTLAQNVPESAVTISGGNVTIDLGGHEWGKDKSTVLTVTGGSVTLENGTLGNSHSCALALSGGEVKIGENMTLWGGKDSVSTYPAISVTNADAKLTLCEGTKLIYGMEVPESRKLSDYLPEGMAFVKCVYDDSSREYKITNEVVSESYTSSRHAEAMAVAKNEHSEDSSQAIKSETELRRATAGYYFLANDITLEKSAWYPQNGTVLDLNGHSITANGNFPVIVVAFDYGFTLLDSKNTGSITHGTGFTGSGIWVQSGSSFTMHGGKITGNTVADKSGMGAGIDIYNNSTAIIDGNVEISGNTITGDYSLGAGIRNQGTLTIGGNVEISGNTITGSSGYGAGIYNWGTMTIGSNAKISGNTITGTYGSGAGIYNQGTVTIGGNAEISGNTITGTYGKGAGIYNYQETVTIGGNAKIRENTSEAASSSGGGIYLSYGTLTLKDHAAITDNAAGSIGGGIYVNDDKALRVSGAVQVTGNRDGDYQDKGGSNVRLPRGCSIIVAGALDGARIGVTVTNTTDQIFATAETAGWIKSGSFVSDNPYCKAVASEDGKTAAFAMHDHAWGVRQKSGSDNVLEEYCTVSGCKETRGTLTISTDENMIDYTGEPVEAKLTEANGWDSGTGTIQYEKMNRKDNQFVYEPISGAPTAAGEYKASVTVSGATASVTFAISRLWLNASDFTFTPPSSFAYDGQPKTAAVTTKKTGVGKITVKYRNAAGDWVESPVQAGTYTVYIDVTEGEIYYGTLEMYDEKWQFTIQPKTLTANDLECTGPTSKPYDGTTDAAVAVRVKDGVLVGNDTLEITGSAVYNSANVKDAKTITFTPDAITDGNYRLEATEKLTVSGSITRAKPKYTVPNNLAAYYGQTLADVTLPDGWRWKDSSASVGDVTATDKIFPATFTPADTDNYTPVEDIPVPVAVRKAVYKGEKEIRVSAKQGKTDTADLSGCIVPDGRLTYKGTKDDSSILKDVTLDGSVLSFALHDKLGTAEVIYTVSSANYEDYALDVYITATEKDNQAVLTITGGTSVVYGQTLQLHTQGGSGTGAVTYRVEAFSTGDASIDENGVLKPIKTGSVAIVATKAADGDYNAVSSAAFVIMITQATPTGAPKYTPITSGGKTLADAKLTAEGGTFSVPGTVKWVDAETTAVQANTAYRWTFTPNDTANYTTLTGSLTPYRVSSGGGGGGSSSAPSYKPSVAPSEGGTATVSSTNPKKGDTVKITPKPADGYEVSKVTVTDKNGKTVAVTANADGTYRFVQPDSKVTIRVEFQAAQPETPDFADVSAAHFAYNAVKWAAEKGITGGIGENRFAPDAHCTRAQIVTFLWRAAGSPVANYAMKFADVDESAYYAEAVRWAAANGIVSGVTETAFDPNGTCTRAQAVTLLARAQNAKTDGAADFADVPADSYYASAVAWAVENGVTNGTGENRFAPNEPCTRAQIVTFLYRAMAE